MLSNIGLVVSRQIPADQIAGILLGTHKVYGGVVRDSLGRISSHLLTSGATPAMLNSLVPGLGALGSMVNAAQIFAVGRDVQQVQQTVNTVLQVATANAALAGLGLVTSVAGFAYLHQRMNKVDAKLSVLEKQVKEVKTLVQSQQKAQLHTAIDNLRHAERAHSDNLRHELLMQSKSQFSTLSHYYREVWGNAEDMHQVDGADEYFTLAFMGGALATSELGMGEVAAAEMKRHYGDWQSTARKHCDKYLLRNMPQRLMAGAMVDQLPARELVEMLDFVNGTQRGIDWIDDLRKMPADFGTALQKSLPGPLQRFVSAANETPAIEFARRLRARDHVLSANIAHFAFLADKKISANYFSEQVHSVLQQNQGHSVCISVASAREAPVA